MPIEKFKLPKGRIVGGHPIKPGEKTNFQTKQPIKAADGSTIPEWRVLVAYPKEVFLQQIWPYMVQEVATMFPINPQTGQPSVNRDFSWKYIDGDSAECPKGSKVPYNAREGYPGHYILTLKTEAFAPGCSVFQNGAYHVLQENQIKCGDYVVANVDIKVHANNDGGLYINPNGFELVELGSAISTGGGQGNPETLFGDAASRSPGTGFQGVLPPAGAAHQSGFTPQPQGGYAPAVQAMPAPVMQSAPIAAPAANAMLMNAPGALPAPAHDFVQQAVGNGYAPAPAPVQTHAPAMPAAPTAYPSNPPVMPGAAPVGAFPQPGAIPPGVPGVAPATTYPTNGIPGLPPAR
jgi:hypothetical protein